MEIRNVFITWFCLITSEIGYSQNLHINIKAEMSDEYIYIQREGRRYKTNIPYLIIHYKNTGNTNIYIKKLARDNEVISFPSKEGLFTVVHTLEMYKAGKLKSLNIDTYPSTTKFLVAIGNLDEKYFINDSSLYSYNSFYRIQTIGQRGLKPAFFDQIGLLKEILVSQYYLNKLDSTKQFPFFDYPGRSTLLSSHVIKNDIDERNIKAVKNDNKYIFSIEEYKNQFVFLKKEEDYIQRIDILPFLIVGGTYTFYLDTHKFADVIKIFNDKTGNFEEFKLPKKFDDYFLYDGDCKTDSTKIVFDNKEGVFALGKKH